MHLLQLLNLLSESLAPQELILQIVVLHSNGLLQSSDLIILKIDLSFESSRSVVILHPS